MEEIKFNPVFSTPFGLSNKEPSPILIGFEEDLPEAIRNSDRFEVWMVCTDNSVEFTHGPTSGNVLIVDGKTEVPAQLREGSEAARIKAVFSFNGRFCGMIETSLPRTEKHPDVGA